MFLFIVRSLSLTNLLFTYEIYEINRLNGKPFKKVRQEIKSDLFLPIVL